MTRAAWHGGIPSVGSPHSYANSSFRGEGYQYAVVSSKNLGQTRVPPTLHHKGEFAYESLLRHALWTLGAAWRVALKCLAALLTKRDKSVCEKMICELV